MNRTLKHLILAFWFYVFLYPILWMAASCGVFGEAEFGYYKGFFIAKHAFQQSDSVEKIGFCYVNPDVMLEEFTFQIKTKSGRVVRFFFDASAMDVYQVCHAPWGLVVDDTAHKHTQLYSMVGLSALMKDKGIQINNLNDIVSHLDELEPLFRTHDGDANDSRKDDLYAWDCLRIEFPNETWEADYERFFGKTVKDLP